MSPKKCWRHLQKFYTFYERLNFQIKNFMKLNRACYYLYYSGMTIDSGWYLYFKGY